VVELFQVTSFENKGEGCLSHCGLAISIQKYLKAKQQELWKLKYFTMQKCNLQKKKSSKENQKSFKIL
jgi:hypothetical protein